MKLFFLCYDSLFKLLDKVLILIFKLHCLTLQNETSFKITFFRGQLENRKNFSINGMKWELMNQVYGKLFFKTWYWRKKKNNNNCLFKCESQITILTFFFWKSNLLSPLIYYHLFCLLILLLCSLKFSNFSQSSPLFSFCFVLFCFVCS